MAFDGLYPYRIENAGAYEDEEPEQAIVYVHTLPTGVEISTLIAKVRDKDWAQIIAQALKDKLEPKR